MTSQSCKNCGRPLLEGEKKYCPHCQIEKVTKWTRVIRGIKKNRESVGVAVLALVPLLKRRRPKK